jgi:homoserine O-acetyltransferase
MPAPRYRVMGGGRLVPHSPPKDIVDAATTTDLESPLALDTASQKYTYIPNFTLESGQVLSNVRVAYVTQGQLNHTASNVVVICHALTGNADAKGDWWPHLFSGEQAPLRDSEVFSICLNVLGSPYGTTSPLTYRDESLNEGRWKSRFPRTTIRDDVR